MTISKKMLMAAVIAGGFASNAAYSLSSKYTINFDYTVLRPLIEESKKATVAVEQSLAGAKSVCSDAKAFAKNMYEQQKDALKVIKNRLKQAYKAVKFNEPASYFSKKQVYKMYKKLVYKNWKKNSSFPTV